MKKARTADGGKNLINRRLRELREAQGYSLRSLEDKLEKIGYQIDRNVIWRIENNERYVTDIEIKAFVEVFNVDYRSLIEGE